jgi:hypothetical protein
VDEENIELVITDLEPRLPATLSQKLPVIAIDNQHAITNTVVPTARIQARRVARFGHGDDAACRLISCLFFRRQKGATLSLPPIVAGSALRQGKTGDYVLVYDLAARAGCNSRRSAAFVVMALARKAR